MSLKTKISLQSRDFFLTAPRVEVSHKYLSTYHSQYRSLKSLNIYLIFFADIDECSSRSLNGCGLGATCVNRVPGYTCECPPGFQGDGRIGCEPAEVRTGCQSDFDCTNNAQCGADRTCRCRQGFEPNGALCIDVNECQRQPDICGPSATCTNTQGGYECRCQPPLTGNPPLEPCKGECLIIVS